MVLEELLKRSKKWAVVPLLGLALVYYPLYSKNSDVKLSEEQVLVSSPTVIESYSFDYNMGVYVFGIKFFSYKAEFYYKKIEENGLVKEFMGAYGRYSKEYHGILLDVVSKDEDPFEKHSYLIRYNKEVFSNETVFYKDKVKVVENGLEKMIYEEGCVGLQSVIKPLFTEDLMPGKVFSSKTFVEDEFYECEFVVGQKETIKVRNKYMDAYHLVLKTGESGSKKKKVADVWVVEGESYNKVVKVSFIPFILTEVVAFLDS